MKTVDCPVIVLVGPTAVGKTELSFWLAEQFNCEIVSMDSMQVYCSMDIGTAKPSLQERAQVPHHLIDIVKPDEQYDAARFVRDALAAIEASAARGKTALLTGGTGLYLKALFEGLFDALPADKAVRERLQARLAEEGRATLHAELCRVDPAAGARIHPNDTQRLLRGLEIFHASGKTWTELIQAQKQAGRGGAVFSRAYLAGLRCPKEELRERIARRTLAMLDGGLIEEVERLRQEGYGPELPSMQAIGYRHANRFLDGEWSRAELAEQLILDTRHYAKRQMTWFSTNKDLRWFEREEYDVLARILQAALFCTDKQTCKKCNKIIQKRIAMVFTGKVNLEYNQKIRTPQRDGWLRIREHYASENADPSVSIVLPVGCGKSGLIAMAPYALQPKRVLIIAPNVRIREQLGKDMKSSSEENFYEKIDWLHADTNLPETAIVEQGRINHDHIRHADIVIANIQQIAGEQNRWLDEFGNDFFDLILVDEGHHNTAVSWQQVFLRYPNAKVINFSATPNRADGQSMEGKRIYSFPVIQAIESGYIKKLSAKMLSPTELTYVERSSGEEKVIPLQEVIKLGQENAEFRRGIVMSEQTLSSTVDCAIGELRRLRKESGEKRLKIIASAVNIDHCIQITEAFRARDLRAAYVHSREGNEANQRIFQQLENHELDAIVQSKMVRRRV